MGARATVFCIKTDLNLFLINQFSILQLSGRRVAPFYSFASYLHTILFNNSVDLSCTSDSHITVFQAKLSSVGFTKTIYGLKTALKIPKLKN